MDEQILAIIFKAVKDITELHEAIHGAALDGDETQELAGVFLAELDQANGNVDGEGR